MTPMMRWFLAFLAAAFLLMALLSVTQATA